MIRLMADFSLCYPHWLNHIASTVSDFATSALALLGAYVGLNPPDKTETSLRRFYVGTFAFVALVGIVSNGIQHSIDDQSVEKSRADAESARKSFSSDLRATRAAAEDTNVKFRDFMLHPPKSLTPQQQLDVVRTVYLAQPAAATLPVSQGAPALVLPFPPNPRATSAPKMFANKGKISGVGFGNTTGRIKFQFRVKNTSQDRNYMDGGLVGASRLLGGLRYSNEVNLDPTIIQRWSDNSIELKFPPGFWSAWIGIISQTAKGRNIRPPNDSDLEIGYQIERTDESITDWHFEP